MSKKIAVLRAVPCKNAVCNKNNITLTKRTKKASIVNFTAKVPANKVCKTKDKLTVINALIKAGKRGLTLDETCVRLNRTPNSISGRFTELKKTGVITSSGRRPTRSGNSANVYVISALGSFGYVAKK